MSRGCCLVLTIVVAGACSCTTRERPPQRERTPPLSKPPADAKASPYRPEVPFETLGPGIATRQLFSARSDAGVQVEVRDLLVGPGQKSDGVTLPGAALVEIRAGAGSLTAGDRVQEVKIGATLLVAEGERLSIANTSDAPLTLRIHLLRAE